MRVRNTGRLVTVDVDLDHLAMVCLDIIPFQEVFVDETLPGIVLSQKELCSTSVRIQYFLNYLEFLYTEDGNFIPSYLLISL
jgi:DNA phosphorothioation-dependent restriction protein DptG